MTTELLKYICEPGTKDPLTLGEPRYDEQGNISEGWLDSPRGTRYRIVRGIPRFVSPGETTESVESFGDQWNYFNFVDFKKTWLSQTVGNTFGSVDVFKGKLIVDAGGGSGSQTLWMLESGARHVILLELSHSVDDVIQRNLSSSPYRNYDVIQCSIDQPPLRDNCIDGMVICHNVIHHTPSVEKTAEELFRIVAPGGEFVFNCYPRPDKGLKNWVRFHIFCVGIRRVVSVLPFRLRLWYAKAMGILRFVPLLGFFLEKLHFCVRGVVPPEDRFFRNVYRKYRATVINTFDAMGSHKYQHHKSDAEIRALVRKLQPDFSKVLNVNEYFSNRRPVQCALRVFKDNPSIRNV